ncbi:MAG TPA: PadR family transcriptional regulator [Sphingomicrobium sp.]|nr:PadR family transcriptional regulator [Sphingomicrobium sp.]
MNTRLLVLGVLHRGDFHPYEIKRRLKAALVECYIGVDVGTLYYAVRQLEKEGLIEAFAQERVARGGIRTTYRITPEGRGEFRRALHRQFALDGPVPETLYGALLFLHLADADIVKDALRRRIDRLTDLIAKLKPIREQLLPVLSTGTEHLLDHLERQRQLDRAWLENLLDDIDANGIRDILDPATLAAAR